MFGFLTAEVARLCGTQRVLGVKSAQIYYVIMAATISGP